MSWYFIVDTYIDEESGRGQYDDYIKQVKPIVEKYGGYYAIGHTKSEFQISIIIPHMART